MIFWLVLEEGGTFELHEAASVEYSDSSMILRDEAGELVAEYGNRAWRAIWPLGDVKWTDGMSNPTMLEPPVDREALREKFPDPDALSVAVRPWLYPS